METNEGQYHTLLTDALALGKALLIQALNQGNTDLAIYLYRENQCTQARLEYVESKGFSS